MEMPVYLMMVGDGMADEPLDCLGGQTPLAVASHPHMDIVAGQSGLRRVQTIPLGLSPGTETAMPLIIGYGPEVLTGRGPVEAAGMGIPLEQGQYAMRMNLVQVDNQGRLTVACPEISDADSRAVGEILLGDAAFCKLLADNLVRYYPQPGFRHMLVGDSVPPAGMTPPHNVQGQPYEDCIPAHFVGKLMKRGRMLLKDHPAAQGVWPWGAGPAPAYEPFETLFGLKGAVITAVPMVRGMAALAGLSTPNVPGATGTVHTDWKAKAQAAMDCFALGFSFVMVHLEAPDDCSHALDAQGKIEGIAMVDGILQHCMQALVDKGTPYRLLLITDHVTTTREGLHKADPVPWCVFDSRKPPGQPVVYKEVASGIADNWNTPIRTLLER